MKFEKKYSALFAASFGLLAVGASAQAAILNGASGTTYEYTAGAPVATPGINFTFTNGQEANEIALVSGNFGTGIMNDGLLGDQAYFNSHPLRSDGYAGVWPAYQGGGSIGQTGVGIPTNTASQDYSQSVYFSGGLTIAYNLGAVYNNLSTVDVYWVLDGTGFPPGALTISDGVHTPVVGTFTNHGDTANTPNANGNYLEDSIDISSLSGQNLTLTFAAPQGSFQAFEEIDFTTTSAVPEPASLGLLSIGGLALLRRKARRA